MKAGYPNQVWSYDFVHDSCLNGEVVKCLTVTDEFTKEALAIEVAASFKAEDVMRTLKRLFQAKGWPSFLRSDNGPEFIAHDDPLSVACLVIRLALVRVSELRGFELLLEVCRSLAYSSSIRVSAAFSSASSSLIRFARSCIHPG